jgi:hypothetical protein
VSAERTIEMAEQALRANEPASASELYESAARELADADRRRAAHLFLLAAWHASSPDREERLAEEAQRIYEAEGDDEKIAEVALVRAAAAMRVGEHGRAWHFYITCARHTALRLAHILPTEHVPEVRGNITPAMEVLFDQLAYCRAKLSELEGS